MELLAIPYLLLLVMGAKATWKLVLNIFPTSVDNGIVFAVILFIVFFLALGPIMGIITLVKYISTWLKTADAWNDLLAGFMV